MDLSFPIWFLVQILGYMWGLFCLRKWHFPQWFVDCSKSWLIYDEDGSFQVGQTAQEPSERATQLTRQLIFSLGPYYTSFRHVDYTNPWSVLYLLPYFAVIPVFGFLGQVKGLQTTLSCGSIKRWPLLSWVVYGVAALLYVGSASYSLYTQFKWEAVIAAAITLLFGVCVTLYIYREEVLTPHFHHWVVGYTGALLNYAHNPASHAIAMLFYGVFVEEVVDYTILDIFSEDEF